MGDLDRRNAVLTLKDAVRAMQKVRKFLECSSKSQCDFALSCVQFDPERD